MACTRAAVRFSLYNGTVGQLKNECCGQSEQLLLSGAEFFGGLHSPEMF